MTSDQTRSGLHPFALSDTNLVGWLPEQDASRTPLTLLTEGQAQRIQELERLVA